MSPLLKFFKNGKDLLNSRENSILSAASMMFVIMVLTKIFGLVTKGLIAYRFGNSRELDMFFFANTIPEFVTTILVFGAINAAFIPVLARVASTKAEEEFCRIISYSFNFSLILFIFIGIVASIFSRDIIEIALRLSNPLNGFTSDEISYMVKIMRFMFLSQVVLGISTIITSVLQVSQRFLITQIAPLFYNFGGIIGVALLVPLMDGSVWGYVIGLFIGSLFHLFIQIPVFRNLKLKYTFRIDFKNQDLRDMFRLAIPRVFGIVADQIQVVVSRVIALGLIQGSLSAFVQAMGIISIPFSLFGHTLSTAAFPFLSKDYAAGRMESFGATFYKTLQEILFFTVPISVLIITLRVPIVRLFFGLGSDTRFNWINTQMTAWVILFFGLAVVFESLKVFLVKVFYSVHDTRRPVIVGMVSVTLGVAVAILASNYFSNFQFFSLRQFSLSQFDLSYFLNPSNGLPAVGGIALGISTELAINSMLLLYFINKKIIPLNKKEFFIPLFKKLTAGLITLVLVYLLYSSWGNLVDTAKTLNVLIMTVLTTITGISIFVTLEAFLEDREVMIVYRFIERRFGKYLR